jgi:septum formation protein
MGKMPGRRLILASASPFRRRMLEAAGLVFDVVPPGIDEADLKGELRTGGVSAPQSLADALARAKAVAVSNQHPGAWVVGADQVLALGDKMFSKPPTRAAARAQLQELRGRTHRLHSAAALAHDGKVAWSAVDTATLTMRDFSDAALEDYLAGMGERVCATVGGYEIEGPGICLFDRVEGDHFTIVGLPLLPLLSELRAREVIGT